MSLCWKPQKIQLQYLKGHPTIKTFGFEKHGFFSEENIQLVTGCIAAQIFNRQLILIKVASSKFQMQVA